jgi:hypothetical protein
VTISNEHDPRCPDCKVPMTFHDDRDEAGYRCQPDWWQCEQCGYCEYMGEESIGRDEGEKLSLIGWVFLLLIMAGCGCDVAAHSAFRFLRSTFKTAWWYLTTPSFCPRCKTLKRLAPLWFLGNGRMDCICADCFCQMISLSRIRPQPTYETKRGIESGINSYHGK